jgi:site-specific recombinase XerD
MSVIIDKQRFRFATGDKLEASALNHRVRKSKSKTLVKRATAFTDFYQGLIDKRKLAIMSIIEKAFDKKTPITEQYLKNEFAIATGAKRSEDDRGFFEFFQEWQNINENQWSANFKKLINSLNDHLKEFEKFRNADITWSIVNEIFWGAFQNYLLNEKGHTNSTINKYTSKLKMFILASIDRDVFKPEFGLRLLKPLKTIPPYEIALSESELNAIRDLDLSKRPELDSTRDIFILSTKVGQRISDLQSIIDKIIKPETLPQKFVITQTKGKKQVEIPLYDDLKEFATEFRNKYRLGLRLKAEQNYNENLKEIGKLANLNDVHTYKMLYGNQERLFTNKTYELISSHTGRRTFATISIINGISVNHVMAITGHTSLKSFQSYLKKDIQDLKKQYDLKKKAI